jgi:hypothetical protein
MDRWYENHFFLEFHQARSIHLWRDKEKDIGRIPMEVSQESLHLGRRQHAE